MTYGQADLTGTDVTWFHVDRTVCDDDGCMCALPTSEQVKARKRASRRGEWTSWSTRLRRSWGL